MPATAASSSTTNVTEPTRTSLSALPNSRMAHSLSGVGVRSMTVEPTASTGDAAGTVSAATRWAAARPTTVASTPYAAWRRVRGRDRWSRECMGGVRCRRAPGWDAEEEVRSVREDRAERALVVRAAASKSADPRTTTRGTRYCTTSVASSRRRSAAVRCAQSPRSRACTTCTPSRAGSGCSAGEAAVSTTRTRPSAADGSVAPPSASSPSSPAPSPTKTTVSSGWSPTRRTRSHHVRLPAVTEPSIGGPTCRRAARASGVGSGTSGSSVWSSASSATTSGASRTGLAASRCSVVIRAARPSTRPWSR